MKPVCVKCEVEMQIECGGVIVAEMFSDPPKPYKLWYADAFKCPICGYVITAQYGNAAFAVQHEPGFEKTIGVVSHSQLANEGWVIRAYELNHHPNVNHK